MARKRRSQKLVKRAESRAGHRASVQQISTTFTPMSAFPAATSSGAALRWPMALAAIWLAGALFLVLRWFSRWRMIHSAVRRAVHLPLRISFPARSSASLTEPGVFGVFRQVLVLPEGIAD